MDNRLKTVPQTQDSSGDPGSQLPPELLNSAIHKRYQLIGEISRDFAGVLYRTKAKEGETELAVKILNPEYDLVSGAMAKIKDPHICAFKKMVKDQEGTIAVIMAAPTGVCAAQLMENRRTLPTQLAVTAVTQLMSVLERVHREHPMVGNLNLASLFLTDEDHRDPQLNLINLGIRSQADTTADPHFQSPEQILGEGVIDARADFWAAGVMLFKMVLGRYPFDGETHNEITGKILLKDLHLPRTSLIFPAALTAILKKTLHKNPERRFGSAREMSAALKTLGDQLGAKTRGPKAALRQKPPAKSTPLPKVENAGVNELANTAAGPPKIGTPIKGSGGAVQADKSKIKKTAAYPQVQLAPPDKSGRDATKAGGKGGKTLPRPEAMGHKDAPPMPQAPPPPPGRQEAPPLNLPSFDSIDDPISTPAVEAAAVAIEPRQQGKRRVDQTLSYAEPKNESTPGASPLNGNLSAESAAYEEGPTVIVEQKTSPVRKDNEISVHKREITPASLPFTGVRSEIPKGDITENLDDDDLLIDLVDDINVADDIDPVASTGPSFAQRLSQQIVGVTQKLVPLAKAGVAAVLAGLTFVWLHLRRAATGIGGFARGIVRRSPTEELSAGGATAQLSKIKHQVAGFWSRRVSNLNMERVSQTTRLLRLNTQKKIGQLTTGLTRNRKLALMLGGGVSLVVIVAVIIVSAIGSDDLEPVQRQDLAVGSMIPKAQAKEPPVEATPPNELPSRTETANPPEPQPAEPPVRPKQVVDPAPNADQPVRSKTVAITFRGMPSNAQVYVNKKEVELPLTVKRSKRAIRIAIRAEGYRSFTKRVVPKRDIELWVSMPQKYKNSRKIGHDPTPRKAPKKKKLKRRRRKRRDKPKKQRNKVNVSTDSLASNPFGN